MQMALKLIALLLIPGASMFGAEPPTRSDTVAEKIRLLEDAYKKGRHDLAMSLAESLKDTLMHERHLDQARERSAVSLDDVGEWLDPFSTDFLDGIGRHRSRERTRARANRRFSFSDE